MKSCVYLSHLACLIAQGVAAPLHLDIINNRVPITLDGHTVKLYLDSAAPYWLVMSGEAYENSNGVGACRELETGCYFCPPTHPCDDILERPRNTVEFHDGDIIEYVSHTGTLSIGNVSDIEVRFDLIISFLSPILKRQPLGILGLALGNREYPSMLDQLKMLEVIKEVSVAIEASETESLLNGRLFLGNSPRSLAELSPVKFATHPTYCYSCVIVLRSTLKPVDRRSQLHKRGSSRNFSNLPHEVTPVLVDTGTAALALTNEEYELMSSGMRDRMQQEGNPVVEPLWKDDLDYVLVDARAIKQLPVLESELMDDSGAELISVRISPKHYVRGCSVDRCTLDMFVTSDTLLCLGHPFFRAYYTYINLDNKTLFITPNNVRQPTSVPRSSTRKAAETLPCPGSARGSSVMTHGCDPPRDKNRSDLQIKRDHTVVPRVSRSAHDKGLGRTRRARTSKQPRISRAGCIECALM